jgi:outer membrane biosynthesis protein TonB
MKVTLWHMLPIAIALHSPVFIIPTPSGEDAAPKPQASPSPIAVTQLPKTAVAKATPSPSPSPTAQRQTPSTPSATPAVSTTPSPTPSPSPTSSPSPSPSPTSSPSPSPSPSPTDGFQIEGAKPGCNGLLGCWQVSETQGRRVSKTIEQQLETQGYTLTQQELNDDVGMIAFEVTKQGVFQYYLHVIWGDRGTTYLRDKQLISSIDELNQRAGL